MNGQMFGWIMDGWTNVRMDNGWIMDGWTNVWMDNGWMDKCLYG